MRIGGLLSIVLLSMGLALPAITPAAATDTPILPTPGGIKVIAQCDKGEAVVGYAYTASQWLTSIGALCEAIKDGKVVPPVFKLKDLHGATAGAPFDPAVCPIGSAITGLSLIYYPMKNAIRSFYTICSKIEGGKAVGKPEAINESRFLPPEALGPVSPGDPSWTPGAIGGIACPEGQFAIAFLGGSAKEAGFLGLGLRCLVGAKPPPPPEDDEATTDTGDNDTMTDGDDEGDDTGITVDSGDNGFKITIQIGPNTLKFGPQGKVRVANEPTTIYAKPDGKKELDYLDKGAKVTVLACEQKGRGWCQIVKPRPGFVWGGDLK